MHELDDTLVARAFEPLVPIYHVRHPADLEFQVREGRVLCSSAFTYCKCRWRSMASEFAFEEVIINPMEVHVWHHIERCTTVSHKLGS